jgi:hypothetical protein
MARMSCSYLCSDIRESFRQFALVYASNSCYGVVCVIETVRGHYFGVSYEVCSLLVLGVIHTEVGSARCGHGIRHRFDGPRPFLCVKGLQTSPQYWTSAFGTKLS